MKDFMPFFYKEKQPSWKEVFLLIPLENFITIIDNRVVAPVSATFLKVNILRKRR